MLFFNFPIQQKGKIFQVRHVSETEMTGTGLSSKTIGHSPDQADLLLFFVFFLIPQKHFPHNL